MLADIKGPHLDLGGQQPFTRLWVKVSNILTTCPYFDNLEFHIFDAGSPQCHFISRLLPLQLGFEGFQWGLPGHFKFFQGHFFQWDVVSGVNRSGDTRDDCMVVFPPINSSIEQWSGVWWSMYLDTRCLWRHNIRSFWHLVLVWRSVLTERAHYSTRTLLTRCCSLQCITAIHIN